MSEDDALIGLRFELSGGLGKMAGEVVGKVGALYLVRRDAADHLELLELDDLRSARFYGHVRPKHTQTSAITSLKRQPSEPSQPEPAPARAKLTDKLRRPKALSGSDD